jgi:hypothetical protein
MKYRQEIFFRRHNREPYIKITQEQLYGCINFADDILGRANARIESRKVPDSQELENKIECFFSGQLERIVIASSLSLHGDVFIQLVSEEFEPIVPEKKKYRVRLYFNGHADFEVEAENEVHALERAEEDFGKSAFSKFVRVPDGHKIEKLEV